MIKLLFVFVFSAQSEVWTTQDVHKMLRAPQMSSENSYLSALCEVQLEQRRVPTACYQDADKSLLRFLDERCLQWISAEMDLKKLRVWSTHPRVTDACTARLRDRIAELEYVQEEKHPLEYFREQKSALARNLKPDSAWTPKHNRKPSTTNYSNVSGKD